MQPQPRVPVAYREPFAIGSAPWFDARPCGENILEIVRSVPNLPRSFLSKGIVCINGKEVPRELWCYVRPKPETDHLPIAVTLHWPLGSPGGGGGGSKQIVGLVAALALILVTYGIASYGLGPFFLGGAFAAGTFGATALGAAVGIAGALAISALTAPPTQDIGSTGADTNTNNLEAASASGNVINPGGAIPRIIGTRKVYPPFICEPLVELVGSDEYVEALLALNGPHLLSDIRVDGVSITDAEDIEIETREGWPSDAAITMVARQGRTITPQITLSEHKLGQDDHLLADQSVPDTQLPIWHGFVSRDSPDEIWIHLLFPGGITNASGANFTVPFRLRMRQRATSSPVNAWINLPEFHISGNNTKQTRRAVVLKWATAEPITSNTVPANNGFIYAHINVPAQTADPAESASPWIADAYFDDGSGNDYVSNGNESSTAITNIVLYDNRMEVFLDEATFPKGIYEFEIKRGMAFQNSNFTKSTYVFTGSVYDFFYWSNSASPRTPQDQTNITARSMLVRVCSVWNEHPVARDGFALIAIKASNRQIQRISMQASGYVKDWDGSGWNTWTTTSNPAAHYVDILSGDQNLDPLPSDLRDDTGLVAWRTLCASNDWTCDAIIDDARTQDALALVASCAYAKPYQSDQYGVTVDNDRSLDSPIQVFSRINASNMKFEKAFAQVPEGFVVGYHDNASDDDRAQTIVYQRDRSIATTGLLESISYEGLVEQDKVEARALFDLDQANQRSTFYSFDSDIESIVCRRGSLVALQHDVLTSRMGDAHLISTITGNSPVQITGLNLDATIPVTNELDMHSVADMHLVSDMHLVGITTGIAIRRTDGTISTHALSDATGDTATVMLATPFTDPGTIIGYNTTDSEYGCLVVAGDLSSEYRRMLVLSITPTNELKAALTLVDEAPSLVRF